MAAKKDAAGAAAPKSKSNLVPAIILAIGAIIGGKFATSGGNKSAAATATTTTSTTTSAASASSTSSGSSASNASSASGGTSTSSSSASDATTTTRADQASAASASGAPSTQTQASASTTTTVASAPAWGYDAATGPDKWASITSAYQRCGDGTMQSPIALTKPVSIGLTDIGFDYKATTATVRNDGHAIAVSFEQATGSGGASGGSASNGIVLDGQRYDLVQLVFHTPSEHVVEGKTYAMEIEAIHRASSGALAVVSVLVNAGEQGPAFDPIAQALPATAGTSQPTKGPVSLAALLPNDRTAIRYLGSLTTPPCTENVRWAVLRNPIQLSIDQVNAISKIYARNNRPLQKANGRTVIVDSGPDS